jgi:hypothetical protein
MLHPYFVRISCTFGACSVLAPILTAISELIINLTSHQFLTFHLNKIVSIMTGKIQEAIDNKINTDVQ